MFLVAFYHFNTICLIIAAHRAHGFVHRNTYVYLHRATCSIVDIRRACSADVPPVSVFLRSIHHQREILTSTGLFSTSNEATSTRRLTHSDTDSTISSEVHKCKFCAEEFTSRNSLFRHIETCPMLPTEDLPASNDNRSRWDRNRDASRRLSLGFRFSYFFQDANENEHEHYEDQNLSETQQTEAQISGRLIQEALQRAIYSRQKASEMNTCAAFQILTSTQATMASQRHKSLTQEVGCGAANDIMTISVASPPPWLIRDESNLRTLLGEMNAILEEDTTGICPRVLEISYLNSPKFHAESCTQYIYHYILPLRWLQDGDKLEQWWLLSENKDSEVLMNTKKSTKSSRLQSHSHPGTFRTSPPSKSFKVLRNSLKAAECITLPNRRVRRRLGQDNKGIIGTNTQRPIQKVAKRKMGTVVNKERRAFHNFADPRLQGEASPNQEPVWRVVDRCRILEIKKNPFNDEVVAVLEFKGDAFLPQQIRRIVGTVVGITNRWLPHNTIDIATRPDIAMEAALAPLGRLYLEDLRFHLGESNEDICGSNSDDRLFASKSTHRMQEQIFAYTSKRETTEKEKNWLIDFEKNIAPKLRNQIRQVDNCDRSDIECEFLDEAPAKYSRVLNLLRQISQSDWPETSAARSKVIKNTVGKVGNKGSGKNDFGSFTIVNPKLFRPTPTQRIPLGNQLFPELVEIIFELEEELSKQTLHYAGEGRVGSKAEGERKPSTHCAVNFNASFTPHVDSGTGLGQSLSMIVGLGDYKGGEIFVEGTAHPIRYQPLEFDGWKQRHWTGTYTGERFSLVWFTPDTT